MLLTLQCVGTLGLAMCTTCMCGTMRCSVHRGQGVRPGAKHGADMLQLWVRTLSLCLAQLKDENDTNNRALHRTVHASCRSPCSQRQHHGLSSFE